MDIDSCDFCKCWTERPVSLDGFNLYCMSPYTNDLFRLIKHYGLDATIVRLCEEKTLAYRDSSNNKIELFFSTLCSSYIL